MIGGLGPGPFRLGGSQPVAGIYESLRQSLPGALKGERGSFSDITTVVQARMVSIAWGVNERRIANESPGTSWDALPGWAFRLGINRGWFDSDIEMREFMAYCDRLDWSRATELKIMDVCRFVLGKIYGNTDRVQFYYWNTWSLTGNFTLPSEPAVTYWPASPGPPEYPWTSRRALVNLLIRRLPTETDEDVRGIVRRKLDPILEWLFPVWGSWTYTIQEHTPPPGLSSPLPVIKRFGDLDYISGIDPVLFLSHGDNNILTISEETKPVVSNGLPVTGYAYGTDAGISISQWHPGEGSLGIAVNGASTAQVSLFVKNLGFWDGLTLDRIDFTFVMPIRSRATNSNRVLFCLCGPSATDDHVIVSVNSSNLELQTKFGGVSVATVVASWPLATDDRAMIGMTCRTNGANKEFRFRVYTDVELLGAHFDATVTRPISTVFDKPHMFGICGKPTDPVGPTTRVFDGVFPCCALWTASFDDAKFIEIMEFFFNNKTN